MSEALDLEAIKSRLAATTSGEWRWADEVGDIPYTNAQWSSGEPITPDNDGSLGVSGLFIEIPTGEDTWTLEPVLSVNDEEPTDPDNPDEVDWGKWRGPIQIGNLADMEFIAHAKTDMAALIAEIERLRALVG